MRILGFPANKAFPRPLVLRLTWIFACALSFVLPPLAGAEGSDRFLPVTVMTRNLYVGADLTPALAVSNSAQLIAAVTAIFAAVEANDFPQRAEALADEIEVTQPDFIGLQEAVLWRSQFPADLSPVPNATTVEFDFVGILLNALAARGMEYEAIAISTGSDLEAPRSTPLGLQDIRLTDREVILARGDLRERGIRISKIRERNFATNRVVSSPVGPIPILRGWVSVNVGVRGRKFRLISTHLDPDSEVVQVAQANELLAGPARRRKPVVLLGDLNSAADGSGTPTYGHLIDAGFMDAWEVARPGDPGSTCCQEADLLNPTSALSNRIDLVLFRDRLRVLDADIVGEDPSERTPGGLWPSDHAGVTATLLRTNRRAAE